jgi:hypothetical protein
VVTGWLCLMAVQTCLCSVDRRRRRELAASTAASAAAAGAGAVSMVHRPLHADCGVINAIRCRHAVAL